MLSSGNTVTPLVLGVDRSPPTQALSALDVGSDGWLSVPGNQSLVSVVNATLQPDTYGMDFWASLEGQLVTVKSPIAIGFPDSYGEFWVRGDWNATGVNSRGGLSITFGTVSRHVVTEDRLTVCAGSDGVPDANPETVILGSPLDDTDLPDPALGMEFEDITGVIAYQYVSTGQTLGQLG